MRFDEYRPEEPQQEPKEPQEEPQQKGPEESGFYATGPIVRKKKNIVLVVLLSSLLVLLCAVLSVLSVLRFHLERKGGRVALYVSDGDYSEEQPQPVEETTVPTVPKTELHGTGTQMQISQTPQDEPAETDSESESAALTLQQIYKKVIPSVVSIQTTTQSGAGSGTGIVMSEDGYIITNYHVIESALTVQVLLEDDGQYSAAVVGGDEASDLAVLKIDAQGLSPAEFGNSDSLEVGDGVVAIGDPLGATLRGTMTDGIISAINRDLTVNGRTMTLIQTNAALNSGNSGGPLINVYGQVIGINAIKISSQYTTATVEGLGFAIPISQAKEVVDELIENGYVAGRPAIGITGGAVPSAARAYYGLPDGVLVESVEPASDAYAQGVRAGDVIIAINGTQVVSVDEMNVIKNQFRAGDTVTLTVYRSGKQFDVTVELHDVADGGN